MIRTLLVSTKPLPSTVQPVQSRQAGRSGVGVDTAYPRHGYAVSSLMDTAYWLTEVTTDIEATTDRAGNSTCNSSVSNTTATPTGVTPLINTTATSTVETNIGGVECERCQNASANKNRGVKVSNEHVNEFPSSYATKLSPTPLTKANLRKHEANVPQDVDYDIWLYAASVHEGEDHSRLCEKFPRLFHFDRYKGVGWRIKEGGTIESGNGNGIGCGNLEGERLETNASWLRNGVAFGFLLLPGCSLFAPPGMRCVFWFLWSDLSILMVPVCFLLLQFEVLCCYNTVVAIL
ncbi:hypothetical protein Tco_1303495 [Tanacetum coccineum]